MEHSWITALYRRAVNPEAVDFQTHALERLGRHIAFDTAGWIEGALVDGQPRMFSLATVGVPKALRKAYRRLAVQDSASLLSLADPVRTLSIVSEDVDKTGTGELPVTMREYGVERVLSTSIVDPETSLAQWVFLARRLASAPFTEEDRSLKEQVTPDLVQSFLVYRRNQVNHQLFRKWDRAHATAICDHDGLLRDVRARFVGLLRKEWPNWEGPYLPEALTGGLGAEPGQSYWGEQVLIRAYPVDAYCLLVGRTLGALAVLTKREHLVAEFFVAGYSYRKLADSLSIAPGTAKTHLMNIYRKLDVSSRTELARLVSFPQDP